MKKMVLILGLCLSVFLASCANPCNSNNNVKNENKTEEVSRNLDFLKINDIMTLPDNGFQESTWISITQNINETEGVFFIQVNGKDIVKYGTMDGLKDEVPNGLSYDSFINAKKSSSQLLKKSYPYWCEINQIAGNERKAILPNFLF